jgi:Uma2 family endonuclease
MPTTIIEQPDRPVPLEPRRKQWTRKEYHAFEDTDPWNQQRWELIEGELINKMGKNRPHVNGLTFVLAWLTRVFGQPFVNPEAPIDVAPEDDPTSEPEPDIIVLKRPSWEFQTGNPQPRDLHLVVEIADTTLGFDLTTKAALYARADIQEYWVLDVAQRRMVVHRDPAAGRYQSIQLFNEDERITPLAAPDHAFLVADAFPS